LGTAAAVGGLRIAAGKHFPTDILAGAAVGSLVGYLVPRLHLRRGPFSRKPEATLAAARAARAGKAGKAGKRKVDVDFALGAVGAADGSVLPAPTVVVRF
jgi:membrane-associated phospholipid phosphatase